MGGSLAGASGRAGLSTTLPSSIDGFAGPWPPVSVTVANRHGAKATIGHAAQPSRRKNATLTFHSAVAAGPLTDPRTRFTSPRTVSSRPHGWMIDLRHGACQAGGDDGSGPEGMENAGVPNVDAGGSTWRFLRLANLWAHGAHDGVIIEI